MPSSPTGPQKSTVGAVMDEAKKMTASKDELMEDTVRRLEAENLMLREKLAAFELITAVSNASPMMRHERSNSLGGYEEALRNQLKDVVPAKYKKDLEHYDEVPTYPERPHFEQAARHPATEVVVFDGCPNDPYHPSTMPIYQTATFVQPNISEYGPYDYTRSGNPTRTALETLVGKLEGAHAAFAFTSGMAALQSLLSLLNDGAEVVAGADLYGGMHRLLSHLETRIRIKVRFLDTTNLEAVEGALKSGNVKLIHVESPTNPLMKITDIRRLCELAHQHGALVSSDSTMMSPIRCHPLALGCDAVIHSGTKFLSGHSDTMSGFVCVKDPEMARRIAFIQNAEGTALAPFDCWLLLRGLKTLNIRYERQEMNAIAVALFLSQHGKGFVKKLHYAGLDPSTSNGIASLSQDAYKLHHSQCSGPGSVMSFETGSQALSQKFVDACKIFKITVSFGSCNSLVEMPCALSHASIPKEKRVLPEDLIRLSIGIEYVHDLIDDLRQAIAVALRDEPSVSE